MEAPKLPTIFKQNRSRGFNYKPVYYSEEKERAEEIRKQIAGDDQSVSKENFRNRLRAEISKGPRGETRSSNFRLLIIIAILCGMAYLIIMY